MWPMGLLFCHISMCVCVDFQSLFVVNTFYFLLSSSAEPQIYFQLYQNYILKLKVFDMWSGGSDALRVEDTLWLKCCQSKNMSLRPFNTYLFRKTIF